MKIEEILVLNEIRENRMEKIKREKRATIRYKKAINIAIAVCRELKVKLTRSEIESIAFKVYR